MKTRVRFRSTISLATLLSLCVLQSCADGPATTIGVNAVSARAVAGGVSVTATNPPFGQPGETQKQVVITGSGFVQGSVASWQRNGVDDPKIHVNATQFNSATQVTATINIAADAALAFYSVAVTNPDRKGGIGTELFEVTQATLIAGTEIAYGGNDNGDVTGRVGVPGVFSFNSSVGLDTLGSPGRGFDISVDGLSIVGGTTINASRDQGYVYVKTGGVWLRTNLPKDPSSTMVRPLGVASDPGTGAATLIGGWESLGSSGTSLNRRPRLWTYGIGSWSRVVLPNASTDDLVFDVASSGVAIGMANNRAASWDPTGPGTWALAVFGAAGSKGRGVNSAGTLAVGEISLSGGKTAAVYWTRTGAVWNAPLTLPGSCTSAEAVDDVGRIVANGCPNGSHPSPAIIAAPYAASNITYLGGLGDAKNQAVVENISLQGTTIVGQATLKSVAYGVMWRIF